MKIDQMGPFSISDLKMIIAKLEQARGLSACVIRADSGPELVEDIVVALAGGVSVIVLWRETPSWGHFIALVPREKTLELFDPLGGAADRPNEFIKYFNRPGTKGAPPARLNGSEEWLPAVLRGWAQKTRLPVSYNARGPQDRAALSCGAWCIKRVLKKDMEPSRFAQLS